MLVNDGDVPEVVRRIVKARPDLIVNTIKGDTNLALFRACTARGSRPSRFRPCLSRFRKRN